MHNQQARMKVMETKRDSSVARSFSVIQARRASSDAARERAVARNAARESASAEQWRRALRQGR